VTRTLTLIVKPVFGEFYRKAVVRRFVETCNEAFNQLPRQQLEAGRLFYIVLSYFHFKVKRFFNVILRVLF
jgi:hypothetical protein